MNCDKDHNVGNFAVEKAICAWAGMRVRTRLPFPVVKLRQVRRANNPEEPKFYYEVW